MVKSLIKFCLKGGTWVVDVELYVSGDMSYICNNIDDRCDKLNALMSEFDSYQSNVESFEESIFSTTAQIKGSKDWESLKTDNLLKIVILLGTKGLEDYEYEKKTGNLILTVNGENDALLNKFDFYKDSKGIIHVLSHCWQRKWGYNSFYDYIFNAATSMNKAKFKFNRGKSDFTLWMWKGDYCDGLMIFD